MLKYKGYTLIELMMVVVIIGVLAAIAYPSYQSYVQRAKRADVQSEMMQIAQRLQSYYAINHNYTAAKLDNGATTKDYPSSGTALYLITLLPSGQTYTLQAEPKASQAGNGTLVLNSLGQKCWIKGSNCVPSASTNWDGE